MKQQLLENEVERLTNKVIDFSAIITQMNSIVQWQTGRIPGMESSIPGVNMRMHPLTCGNDSNHSILMPLYDLDRMRVVLVCPDCDYTQEYLPPVVTAGAVFSK